jgi:hypothetical protein
MHTANSPTQNPLGNTHMDTLTKKKQPKCRIASKRPIPTTLQILRHDSPVYCCFSKHSLAKMPSTQFPTHGHRLSTRRTHLLALLMARKLKRHRPSRHLMRTLMPTLLQLKTRQKSSVCITWASLYRVWKSSLTGSWRVCGSRIWTSSAATMRCEQESKRWWREEWRQLVGCGDSAVPGKGAIACVEMGI